MAKKDKPAANPLDTATYAMCILGSLLVVVTIIPYVPWRQIPVDSNFGARFTMDRKIHLLSATDKNGGMVPWFTWQSQMCQAMKQFNTPSVQTAVVGGVVSGLATVVGSAAPGIGAVALAAGGCGAWPACKSHVAARCNGYFSLALLGLFATIFLVASAITGFVVPIMMGLEASAASHKKKKRQEKLDAAKFSTMVCSIVAFVLSFVGLLMWQVGSDSIFKGFQNTGYYPYPSNFVAPYLGGIGVAFQLIGMLCAILRRRSGKKEGGEEEDEGEEPLADPSLPPMQAPLLGGPLPQ